MQIEPNGEQVSPEAAHRSRIPAAARYLIKKPALALPRIIVGKQMGRAAVPVGVHPVAQLQQHARGLRKYIADVFGFHSVLWYDRYLHPTFSVGFWIAALLSRIVTSVFEMLIQLRVCE